MNDEYFEYAGVWWVWTYNNELGGYFFEGPRCRRSDCRRSLIHASENNEDWKLQCPHCKKVYILPRRIKYDTTQSEIYDAYEAQKMQHKQAVPLDRKPTASTARYESPKHNIEVKVREENEQEVAYIYISKKGSQEQSKGQKVQFIVDIADEELRHDANDLPPGEIVSSIKVRFKNSTTDIKYN